MRKSCECKFCVWNIDGTRCFFFLTSKIIARNFRKEYAMYERFVKEWFGILEIVEMLIFRGMCGWLTLNHWLIGLMRGIVTKSYMGRWLEWLHQMVIRIRVYSKMFYHTIFCLNWQQCFCRTKRTMWILWLGDGMLIGDSLSNRPIQ